MTERPRSQSRTDPPAPDPAAADLVDQAVEKVRPALRAVKPKLRGWLHLGTFPVALVAGIVLVALADGTRETVAAAVYAASACLLFGISALYHRGTWSPATERWLKRLDHSNIFLIIAGTYTPFSVVLLPGQRGSTLLWIVWIAALGGIAFRVLWVGAPRWLYTPVYIALGWVAVFYLPDLLHTGGVAVVVLLAVGGALYSAGGIVYALKRPNPSPLWFGFHEVFHALTLVAFITHYVAVSIATYSAAAG